MLGQHRKPSQGKSMSSCVWHHQQCHCSTSGRKTWLLQFLMTHPLCQQLNLQLFNDGLLTHHVCVIRNWRSQVATVFGPDGATLLGETCVFYYLCYKDFNLEQISPTFQSATRSVMIVNTICFLKKSNSIVTVDGELNAHFHLLNVKASALQILSFGHSGLPHCLSLS